MSTQLPITGLVFALVAALWVSNAAAIDLLPALEIKCEEKGQPNCKALKLYYDARELYDDGKWRQADRKAREARNIVPKDGRLEYLERCMVIVNPNSFNKKLKYSDCKKTRSYYPSELISEIRSEHPPQPAISLQFASTKNAWAIAAIDRAPLNRGKLVVTNAGKSTLESFYVSVSKGTQEIANKVWPEIDPGEHGEFEFNASNVSRIAVTTSERYGHVLPRISFSLK